LIEAVANPSVKMESLFAASDTVTSVPSTETIALFVVSSAGLSLADVAALANTTAAAPATKSWAAGSAAASAAP
jgi:hypothetical protein